MLSASGKRPEMPEMTISSFMSQVGIVAFVSSAIVLVQEVRFVVK